MSSTAAPHWADLVAADALVDVASAAAAPHWAALGCVVVEEVETSAAAAPQWAAPYGVHDDVEDSKIPDGSSCGTKTMLNPTAKPDGSSALLAGLEA